VDTPPVQVEEPAKEEPLPEPVQVEESAKEEPLPEPVEEQAKEEPLPEPVQAEEQAKEEPLPEPVEEPAKDECTAVSKAVDPYKPTYSQAIQFFKLSFLSPSKQDLQTRYREIALRTHPDRAQNAGEYDTFYFATACKVEIFQSQGWSSA
jgi:hypothetical protein